MQELEEWLNNDNRNYQIGLGLYSRFCKNRTLFKTLAKKEKPSKLLYELNKAYKRANKTVNATNNIKEEKEPLKTAENDSEDIEGMFKAYRVRAVYSECSEDIKKEWQNNIELRKKITILHEKSKHARNDHERSVFLGEVEKLRTTIQRKFEEIDAWYVAKKYTEKNPVKVKELTEKEIKNMRAYLSKSKPKLDSFTGTKRQMIFDAMQKRITAMINNDVAFEEDTLKDYKKRGFNILKDGR